MASQESTVTLTKDHYDTLMRLLSSYELHKENVGSGSTIPHCEPLSVIAEGGRGAAEISEQWFTAPELLEPKRKGQISTPAQAMFAVSSFVEILQFEI